MAEGDFQYEYKANVKEKIKQFDSPKNSGNSSPSSSHRSRKSRQRNNDNNSSLSLEHDTSSESDIISFSTAAVMDVEATQIGTEEKEEGDNRESNIPPTDVNKPSQSQPRMKDLLRRFSMKNKAQVPVLATRGSIDLEGPSNDNPQTSPRPRTRTLSNSDGGPGEEKNKRNIISMMKFQRRNSLQPEGTSDTSQEPRTSSTFGFSRFLQFRRISRLSRSMDEGDEKAYEPNNAAPIPLQKPRATVTPTPKEQRENENGIEKTEVSTLLEIGWENVDLNLRQMFPSSLATLQETLQKEINLRNFSDLPEEPAKVMQLLKNVPLHLHNPVVSDLLTETLQMKVPSCYSALYIGQGYDLSKDCATQVSPFQFSGTLKTSTVGLIPNEINFVPAEDDREIIFRFYTNVDDYVSDRFKDIGVRDAMAIVSGGSGNYTSIPKLKTGYNLVTKLGTEPTKTTTATASVEYRIVQFGLEISSLNFKLQFWESLIALPHIDGKSRNFHEAVDSWTEFFRYWGTHVVKSAHAGGSIQVTFRGKILSKIFKSLSAKAEIPTDELETSQVFQWLTGDGLNLAVQSSKPDYEFLLSPEFDVDTTFHGGDMKFQRIDLTKMSHEKVASTRQDWIRSLTLNPTILEGGLTLVPMSYLVRDRNEGLAMKMDVAFVHCYATFMGSQGNRSSCSIV